MKTTIELPDDLFRQAKHYAVQQGIPMREVVERGVRVLVEGKQPKKKFRLRTITTKGDGLICDGDWNTIRSLIYDGHGG